MNEQDQSVNSGEWEKDGWVRTSENFWTKGLRTEGRKYLEQRYNRALAQLRQPVSGTEEYYVPSIEGQRGGQNIISGLEKIGHERQGIVNVSPVNGTEQKWHHKERENERYEMFLGRSRLAENLTRGDALTLEKYHNESQPPQPVSAEADEIAREAAGKLLHSNSDYRWHEVKEIIRDAIARAKDAEIEKQYQEYLVNLQEADAKLTAAEEQLAALRKDKELAERRAGAWMRLASRGRLPVELNQEFQVEFDAALATKEKQ